MMVRKYYHETDSGAGQPNTIHQDRIGPMRGYFNALPDVTVNDCDTMQDVWNKYPELFVDNTHRDAVVALWVAGGHMLDP